MLYLLALLVALPLSGLFYQWLGERRDRRQAPAPGRLLRGLHLHQTGTAGPWVLFEAGIAASSVSWGPVQDALSAHCRVLSYDRAGFGYSAARSEPRTLAHLLMELDEVLPNEPVLLVGHSFGGLLARHYAAAHPDRVRALLLLDPLEPLEWAAPSEARRKMLARGVLLSRRGATLARFGVVRLGLDLLLSGARFLPKLLAKASSGRGSSVPDRLVGEVKKLPSEVWPAVKAHWCLPRSFKTMADYLERLPEACSCPVPPCPAPVTVLSAASNRPEVLEAHARTASPGRHRVVEAGHWVQLDRPDLVVEAVLESLRLYGS